VEFLEQTSVLNTVKGEAIFTCLNKFFCLCATNQINQDDIPSALASVKFSLLLCLQLSLH